MHGIDAHNKTYALGFVSAISLDGFLGMPLERPSGTSWASLAQPLSDGPKNG